MPLIDVYNLFVTKPISVTTTTFTASRVNNVYTSVLNDQLNYGQLNLRLNSAVLMQVPAINVSYTGGYLAGGTYTLLSSDVANSSTATVGTLPTNTMFLRFNRPVVTNTRITMNITRTPFQAIATNGLAQDIGASLEYIGSHNPSVSDMTILNILETSNSANQLNNYLLQLAPLASAATQSLNVQNISIRQPMTRLTATHGYTSGDQTYINNVWIRPFGGSVTQHTINNINGYSAQTAGLAIGADKDINDAFTLGIGASYAYANIADKVHASSHTYLNAYQGMVYGSKIFGSDESWYWDWLGAVAYNTYDANRKITLPSYNSTATANYNNNNYSALSVLGKTYENGRCRFMPELSAQYTLMIKYNYIETGAPGANLTINKSDSNIIQLGAWLRTTSLVSFKKLDLIPEAHIAGLYNVLNTNRDLGFQFNDGGGQILSNMGPNNAAARIGCAFTLVALHNLDFKFNFDVELQNEYTDYSAYLNLRYLF